MRFIKQIVYFSEAKKKHRRRTSKNRSIPEDLGKLYRSFAAKIAASLTSTPHSCLLIRIIFCVFLDVTDGFVEETVEEDAKSNRSVGNLKEKPKKKKKVRKVMSWNF